MYVIRKKPTYFGPEGETVELQNALLFASPEVAERFLQDRLCNCGPFEVIDERAAQEELLQALRRKVKDASS